MRQITYGNHKQQFENKRTYGRIVRKQKSKKLGLRGLLLLILFFLAFFAGRASVARAGEMANHSESYRYRSVKSEWEIRFPILRRAIIRDCIARMSSMWRNSAVSTESMRRHAFIPVAS